MVQPGTELTPHHAGHAGAGLAMDHAAAARDLESIRAAARGREALVDELEGATTGRPVRAQALLAREIAPGDPAVAAATVDRGVTTRSPHAAARPPGRRPWRSGQGDRPARRCPPSATRPGC